MTPNQLALMEQENEEKVTTEKDVERRKHIRRYSDCVNNHLRDTDVPRDLQTQYEAFLTDPRRI